MTPSTSTYNRLVPIGDAPPGTPGADTIVSLIFARRDAIVNSLRNPKLIARMCRRVVTWGENIDSDNAIPDGCVVLVNKIKGACETQVANHLKEPIQVTIEGVETGEYAPFYWAGPPDVALELTRPIPAADPTTGAAMTDPNGQPVQAVDAQGTPMSVPMIDPLYLGGVDPTTGAITPPLPLPNALAKELQAMAQADAFDPQFICRLDDEYTAKQLQREMDQDLRDVKFEKWMRSRIWANTVEGWQLPLYEWDQRMKRHILRRNSVDQTYIDQSAEDIDDAVEAGIDLYLDLDEALSVYPDQAAAMLDPKTSGGIVQGPIAAPGTSGMVPVQYRDNFERPMLMKVVWWLRNQSVGIKTAIAAGLVEERSVIDESLLGGAGVSLPGDAAGSLPDSPDAVLGRDSVAGADSVGETGSPDGAEPTDPATAITGTEGVDSAPSETAIPQMATRTALYLAGTQTELTGPADPNWPTALRQITIVGNTLIEDAICRLPDIPLAHMRNTLVIGRPWGVGEPFHTKQLQDAYSMITTAGVDHAHFAAHPAREMHEDLFNHLMKDYGTAHMVPNRVISVPARHWNANTPTIRTIEAPPFPESTWRIRDAIGQDFNQIGGQNDVMTGNIPSPSASGRMVANLQQAAVEPLNFKAQEIAFCAQKLAELMLYSSLKFKTLDDWARGTSLPKPFLSLVLQRAIQRPPNTKITISTGAGSVIERKRATYLAYNQTVDPATKMPILDIRSTREALSLDSPAIDRRIAESVRATAMVMAPMMQQQAEQEAAASGGGESEKAAGSNGHSSNGNGRF